MQSEIETARARVKLASELYTAKHAETIGARHALGDTHPRTLDCERALARYAEDLAVWLAAVVALGGVTFTPEGETARVIDEARRQRAERAA